MNTQIKATSEPIKHLNTQHYSKREISTPLYFDDDMYFGRQQQLNQFLIKRAMEKVKEAVQHKYKIIDFFCEDIYGSPVPQDIVRLISTIFACFCGCTRCICCIKQKKI